MAFLVAYKWGVILPTYCSWDDPPLTQDWLILRLEDPTLTDFNFNNLHMPPAHLEAWVQPVDPVRLPVNRGTHETAMNKKTAYLGAYRGIYYPVIWRL